MASEQSIGRRKSQGEPERVQVNCFSTVIETPKVPINLPTAMIVLLLSPPPTKALFEEWGTVQKLGRGHSRQRDENKQEIERYTPVR